MTDPGCNVPYRAIEPTVRTVEEHPGSVLQARTPRYPSTASRKQQYGQLQSYSAVSRSPDVPKLECTGVRLFFKIVTSSRARNVSQVANTISSWVPNRHVQMQKKQSRNRDIADPAPWRSQLCALRLI